MTEAEDDRSREARQCRTPGCRNSAVKLCPKCKEAIYCSTRCQKKHRRVIEKCIGVMQEIRTLCKERKNTRSKTSAARGSKNARSEEIGGAGRPSASEEICDWPERASSVAQKASGEDKTEAVAPTSSESNLLDASSCMASAFSASNTACTFEDLNAELLKLQKQERRWVILVLRLSRREELGKRWERLCKGLRMLNAFARFELFGQKALERSLEEGSPNFRMMQAINRDFYQLVQMQIRCPSLPFLTQVDALHVAAASRFHARLVRGDSNIG